jgi:hypothetical protein
VVVVVVVSWVVVVTVSGSAMLGLWGCGDKQ